MGPIPPFQLGPSLPLTLGPIPLKKLGLIPFYLLFMPSLKYFGIFAFHIKGYIEKETYLNVLTVNGYLG